LNIGGHSLHDVTVTMGRVDGGEGGTVVGEGKGGRGVGRVDEAGSSTVSTFPPHAKKKRRKTAARRMPSS
jgi:hypothetical protein